MVSFIILIDKDADKNLDYFLKSPKLTISLSGPVCPEGTLQCSDGQTCISTKTQCDGSRHCPDGGDEDEEFCKGRFLVRVPS